MDLVFFIMFLIFFCFLVDNPPKKLISFGLISLCFTTTHTMNTEPLQQYEKENPHLLFMDKDKPISVDDLLLRQTYLLWFPDDKDFTQVVYQGKRNTFNEFTLGHELTRKENTLFGFRTMEKPYAYYDILQSDMGVNCFVYEFYTRHCDLQEVPNSNF